MNIVGFEVITTVVMNSAICFHAGIMLGLFDPEDGCDMFLRNAG
jgi:hypothetical protein